MILTLPRDFHSAECTLGKLTAGSLTLDTIEPPWIDDPAGGPGGAPSISCVPAGTYQLVLHDSAKHPRTWALVNHDLGIYADPTASMRDDCLIHPANYAYELEGCIAPGLSRLNDGTRWMVTSSVSAFQKLQAIVPWMLGHTLVISD